MRPPSFGTSAALVAGLALAGCLASSAARADDRPPRVPRDYNVIVYVLDTTRADHFGLYGYARETTPYVDALAGDGIVWERATSSSTHTFPGTSTILTGVTTASHRASRFTSALSQNWPTLPELLRAQGFESWLITSNPVLMGAGRQLAARFDEATHTYRPDANLTDLAIDYLERAHAKPFLLFLQPRACHSPYEAPPPFDELFVGDSYYGGLGDVPAILPGPLCEGGMPRVAVMRDSLSMDWYVAQYDGLLAYMDREIQRLMQALESLGLRDSTLVIITADHGEMLAGEHGYYFCHRSHYQGNTHVPLIMLLPPAHQRRFGSRAGEWRAENVGHVDLAPTILELLNIERPSHFEGRDLLAAGDRDESESHILEARALHYRAWKVIHRGALLEPSTATELYHLPDDPRERHDLAAQEPVLLRKLESALLESTALMHGRRPPGFGPGPFLRVRFDLSTPLSDVGAHWDLPGFRSTWSVVPHPDAPQNGVLHARHLRGGGADPSLPVSTLGLFSEPDSPYSAGVRVRLERGRFSLATSALHSEISPEMHPQWGNLLAIGAERASLWLLRPRLGLELVDTAPLQLALGDWHTVRLENDGVSMSVVIDGQPLLFAASGSDFFYGTTFLGLYRDSEAYFDDLVQWR